MITSGQTRRELRVVMPACLGGELWQLLDSTGAMSEAQLRFYAACVVLALSRLHSLGVVYRDLKPENVLLQADGWPVLADVGLAAFAQDERPLFSLCGTAEYMAPEVVAQPDGYNAAADFWSLGVLLSKCLTLTTPFLDFIEAQTCVNIFLGRVTAPASLDYHNVGSAHLAALIDALLCKDTGRRLKDAELRLHPFFWGLDWAALQRRQLRPPHAEYAAANAKAVLASYAQWEQQHAGDGEAGA